MSQVTELVLQFLAQIGGGPAAPENNLVRFGLPALFWTVLLVVAWSRQRREHLPRERLLVWGFGLALLRELFMLAHTVSKLLDPVGHRQETPFVGPLEHALGLAAVIFIAGAFMRYILDETHLPRRYLEAGTVAVVAAFALTSAIWYRQLIDNPGLQFHKAGPAWILHVIQLSFIAAAVYFLVRKHGWLRNTVIVALLMLAAAELLILINYATAHAYNYVLCPVGNNLHIWAVPIFGFVYFREQAIERDRMADDLAVYRGHLEQLVAQRTAELSAANAHLRQEVTERAYAEQTAAELYKEADAWAAGMERLQEISLVLSATLDPDKVCSTIVSEGAGLLGCTGAGLFRLDAGQQMAVGVASHGMVKGGVDGIRLPIQQDGIFWRMAAADEPLVIEDAQTDPRIAAQWWQRYPMRALLGMPVREGGDICGFLFLVEAERTRQWRDTEVRLLRNFADRAGAAWENAHLHKQLEQAAALEERQRIAADMHDGLAQMISTLALRNDQAAQMVEDGRLQPALVELNDIQEIIVAAGTDLRQAISSLSKCGPRNCSLQQALEELLASVFAESPPQITFRNELGVNLRLPPEQLDQVVSIANEALLNARRHAGARHITLRLGACNGRCVVAVEDDGCGFEADEVSAQPGYHFGLSIMRARADRLPGELLVESRRGSGTRVSLTWAPDGANGDGPWRGIREGSVAFA